MTLGRLGSISLACLILAAALFAGVWYVRYVPYRDLLVARETVIAAARRNSPVKSAKAVDPPNLPSTPTQVIVSTADNLLLQARYYDSGRLTAVDFYGSEQTVVRRDVFDDMVRLRIRIYYDVNQTVVVTEYIDQSGAFLARLRSFLFFSGRGTGY